MKKMKCCECGPWCMIFLHYSVDGTSTLNCNLKNVLLNCLDEFNCLGSEYLTGTTITSEEKKGTNKVYLNSLTVL
jgi:hypothetical protein